MPETTKIWNKQQETKKRAKMQGKINRNSQCEVAKEKKRAQNAKYTIRETELTENGAPYICNYICVIETTSVFSPNSNLLEDIKMVTSKTSDI